MRRTRRLLLLAILLILAGVGITYHLQRGAQERSAQPPPKSLPKEVSAAADYWSWAHTDGNRPVVEVRARNFRQVKEPSRFELEDVELRFFHKDAKAYDKVRSAKADFDIEGKLLYSPGDVEITLAVPADGAPKGRLLIIRSSGVSFESTSGKARTEKPASFTFDTAEGQSVGASYDPSTRELRLDSEVRLLWRGSGLKPRPMRVEAGELVYNERESKVFLGPWARLSRETMTLESAAAVVTLQDGAIQQVEAQQALGSDQDPRRSVDYQAKHLVMQFSKEGEVEHITGNEGARLVSSSGSGRTTVTANRVDLAFDLASGESQLAKTDASGAVVVESVPAKRPNAPQAASRLLRSENVVLRMRKGGRETESVETHSPGEIDFLPNRPGDRRRNLRAERMSITYAAGNEIESFRAVDVATRTERESAKKTVPPALTWSKDLAAEFDPKTGQMRRLEQWSDFRYEEGDRRARADRATLESAEDVITLTGRARVSDPNGSTDADVIVLDQKTGDFSAEGRVTSIRLPDKKGSGSAMLASDQAVQARAQKMSATGNNRRIVYETDAVLWQDANRLQADRIEIDREKKTLAARGRVISQFLDRPKPAAPGKPQVQKKGFTVIRAPQMTYADEKRLAHYTGGVTLERSTMVIRAREIRAYLSDSKSDTSLDRAFADGQVAIVQTAPDRKRTGTSEHAEYYELEQRVVLAGGEPQLIDTVRGTTRGERLTYFANQDHLIVEGGGRPAVSRLRRQ